MFRSHNDSTFFEVNIEVDVDSEGNPIPTTKNIQGTIFDTQNEAAQIEAVKKILWERTGRSRKK